MKLYIILTYDIRFIGGTQTYTWGKCEYLSRNGWDTAVFFPGENVGTSPYTYLNKYVRGGLRWFSNDVKKASKNVIRVLVGKMLRAYNIENNKYDEIIIESHYDAVAVFGERVAEYLHAKHICFICNECFDEPKEYNRHLEFYKFKYDRKELYGIHKSSIKKLLEHISGNIPETEELVFHAYYPYDVVQDIWDKRLEIITKADWNIVYFSRADKGYLEKIIKDVAEFAKKYNSKVIQFIIVSDAFKMKKYIDETFSDVGNIRVRLIGEMSPIPKKIFEIADVVIAGSGCAGWSYKNNAYTLIPDAKNTEKANGFLGYDTFSTLYAESIDIQKDFSEYLEKLLVFGEYEKLTRKELFQQSQTNATGPDNRYDLHFRLIEKSIKDKEYFNFSQPSNNILCLWIDQLKLLAISNDFIYGLYKLIKLIKK